MTEKRIIAAVGATGAACSAAATALFGVDTLATDVAPTIKVFALIIGAAGVGLSGWVNYYKGAAS